MSTSPHPPPLPPLEFSSYQPMMLTASSRRPYSREVGRYHGSTSSGSIPLLRIAASRASRVNTILPWPGNSPTNLPPGFNTRLAPSITVCGVLIQCRAQCVNTASNAAGRSRPPILSLPPPSPPPPPTPTATPTPPPPPPLRRLSARGGEGTLISLFKPPSGLGMVVVVAVCSQFGGVGVSGAGCMGGGVGVGIGGLESCTRRTITI